LSYQHEDINKKNIDVN